MGLRFLRSLSSPLFCVLEGERERRRLSWRLRLGLGEPEELDDDDERELEDPERLEPEELDPLEEPELEPELLLDDELDLLLLLLPEEALRRFFTFSLPLSLSPSLVPVLSLPLSFVFSSSFRFVGDGAILYRTRRLQEPLAAWKDEIGRAHV